MKCIEDKIPFELPEGWAWARLGAVAEAISDGDHQPPPQTSSGIPFLVISNVSGGVLSFENTRFVSVEYFNQLPETRKPRNGDLLFTVTGSYGIPVLVDTDDNFCFQRHIAMVRPCIISNRYLYIMLGSSYVKSICDNKATGIAQKTVGLSTLRELLVPIAPLSQQIKIYEQAQSALCVVDGISSDREDLLKTINNAKAKILDLAIRGQLVPQDPADEPASVLLERIRAEKEELIKQGKIKRDKKESVIFRGEDNSYYEKIGSKVVNIDDEITFELPNNWAWSRGYSCFEGMESTKPKGEFFDYIDIDAIDNRLHQIKEAKHLPVSDAPSRASRAVKNGSVLFSLVRPYLENIALIEEKHSHCIASTGFYICNSNGAFLPKFMFYLMISGYVVGSLNQYMKGDNSPSISKDNIEGWLYPIPPVEEQKKICDKLQVIFALIENVEKSLS
ncbi:restriction endonuclease subunit S [Pseudoflavonifractor phocaeensis]|uniref:restriction endonuclease subunit S n=1 Tax=Pseudoflavonifractor phocaeensis TaxID=1870988 RepID=UPI001F32631F|nr:restriction endonuclease subunit S [Pseudoflavonifractor phocaeensis]